MLPASSCKAESMQLNPQRVSQRSMSHCSVALGTRALFCRPRVAKAPGGVCLPLEWASWKKALVASVMTSGTSHSFLHVHVEEHRLLCTSRVSGRSMCTVSSGGIYLARRVIIYMKARPVLSTSLTEYAQHLHGLLGVRRAEWALWLEAWTQPFRITVS